MANVLARGVFFFASILIGGCSSIKSSEPLPYALSPLIFDKRTEKHVPVKTTVKNMVDKNAIEYFWVLTGEDEKPAVALSQQYMDEYKFLIDQFLLQYPNENHEAVDLGTAHSVPEARLKFSSIYVEERNYLSLSNCVLGSCGDSKKGVIILDKENVELLKNHISEYSANKKSSHTPFNPPAVDEEGYARVYLYRLHSPPLAIDYPVEFNGQKIGAISADSALPVLVRNGTHAIRIVGSTFSGIPEVTNTFEFKAGNSYFIKYSQIQKIELTAGILMNLDADADLVKNELPVIARNDLKKCKIMQEVEIR